MNKVRFGRLTVLKRTETLEKRARVLVRCDCGVEKIVRVDHLVSGNTHSCGCWHREQIVENSFRHGQNKRGSRTAEYSAWHTLIQRCCNPRNARFSAYGGRGIRVAKRWLGVDGFKNFFADMGKKPSPKHQLDRKNNNGNYCKGNCRWATVEQQGRNTRSNRILVFRGQRKTMVEWAEITGIKHNTIWHRISRGWSTERALTAKLGAR